MEDKSTELRNSVETGRKWLIVSICGLIIFTVGLGLHFLRGGSNTNDPLPQKVLNQIFGFTPYYFEKNNPPSKLRLQTDTPKFYGNIFSFTLKNGKYEHVTVNQKTLPSDYKNTTDSTDETVTTDAGSGYISDVKDGHISATFVTKEKTLITLESDELLSSNVLKNILMKLVAFDKTKNTPLTPEL
jgi:hypothetical protein